MTRRHEPQLTIAQLVLFGVVVPRPEDLMDAMLRRIDGVLEDETLVEHVLAALRGRYPHSATRGRPGTPAEVVLRLLVLKHLRDWSYDDLEREVAGSIVYRRFCRIDGGKVPDAKTMVRLGQLLDGAVLRDLLGRVVAMAVEARVTRGRKVRIDTTVVEGPVRHPTDSGLCEDVVRVLRREMKRLVAAGVKLAFRLRNVGRSVGRRMREIAQAARRRGEAARKARKKPYRKLLRITGRFVRQAKSAVEAGREQLGGLRQEARAAAARALEKLATMLPRAKQVVRQTRARILRGVTDLPGKIVSVFEPHVQILRRGKPHKPTEFGTLVKVQEIEGGIVSDIDVVPEKADAPLLVPSIERHLSTFGHAPDTAATDRGFYSTDGEKRIRDLGVKHPAIPKPGHRSKERILYEKKRWFRRARAWRSGGEARISLLNTASGWRGVATEARSE
jgi:IS5 family transposase